MKKLTLFVILLLFLSGCVGKGVETKDIEDDTVEIKPITIEDEELTEETPVGDREEIQGPYKPVAVMIENSPAARPQSGLIDADVVYEIYVEGGITRFLALFLSRYPEIAGPVRSVRHYYLDIAQEWDTYLVHFGGSPLAREQFDKVSIRRLDGITGNKLFWRDNSRKAPHNAYIDTAKCRELIDFEQKRREIKFTKEPPTVGEPYSSITIPYNSTFSKVEYTYDESLGKNMRGTSGTPSTNKEDGEQLFADNIVVQYVGHEKMDSGVGYKKVDLIGSGKAQYFIGGKYLEGSWDRSSGESPTQFLDGNGEEIEFMEGNIWIQIVPNNMKVIIE